LSNRHSENQSPRHRDDGQHSGEGERKAIDKVKQQGKRNKVYSSNRIAPYVIGAAVTE